MASTCEFPGEILPDALCTAFVLGLCDENIPCKLLSEKDLTLDKAISIAQNMEAAGKEANEITVQTPNSVSIIKTPSVFNTEDTSTRTLSILWCKRPLVFCMSPSQHCLLMLQST